MYSNDNLRGESTVNGGCIQLEMFSNSSLDIDNTAWEEYVKISVTIIYLSITFILANTNTDANVHTE